MIKRVGKQVILPIYALLPYSALVRVFTLYLHKLIYTLRDSISAIFSNTSLALSSVISL